MIKKIDHIGIAVRDAEKTAKFYRETLGIALDQVVERPGELKILFFPVGETDVELIEPLQPKNWVAEDINRKGEGLHHICIAVDDIYAEVKRLAELGVPLIDKEPRPGAKAIIAFLDPQAAGGVLIELSQAR